MSQSVYCVTCGRPTNAVSFEGGYRIRVHRRADKPKDPLVLCSGWRRHDHLPILLGRERSLADAMDEEEDIRCGIPDDRTIVAGEVHSALAATESQPYVLIRVAGNLRGDPESTEEASMVFEAKHLPEIINQLTHLQAHLNKDWN